MGRPSTTKPLKRKPRSAANARAVGKVRRGVPAACEECWPLVGERRGRIWCGRKLRRTVGDSTRVEFDGVAVLTREEKRRDIIGFLHTHPDLPARPSPRDIATMQAWVSAFGKPLLCLIAGTDGLAGFCFDSDASRGERLAQVEAFPRGFIVAVSGS